MLGKSEKAARIRPREVALVATDTRLRGHSLNGENFDKTKEFASHILFKLIFFKYCSHARVRVISLLWRAEWLFL